MPVSDGFQNFVVEQLEIVGTITAKKMFGGVGLYANGIFFALIAEDQLFFKVDDSNRPDFEAVEMGPFRPYDDDRAMAYYEIPVDVLEDADELALWAEKAIGVARNAKKGKKRK